MCVSRGLSYLANLIERTSAKTLLFWSTLQFWKAVLVLLIRQSYTYMHLYNFTYCIIMYALCIYTIIISLYNMTLQLRWAPKRLWHLDYLKVRCQWRSQNRLLTAISLVGIQIACILPFSEPITSPTLNVDRLL